MQAIRGIAVWTLAVSMAAGQALWAGPASAQGAYLYAIAANDGYGLQECLSGNEECGQVVADAWCEAHGHGRAVSYGPATKFNSGVSSVSTSSDAYMISCGD